MIDVEMFLKLKRQHGDVLETKTLIWRPMKMATTVQNLCHWQTSIRLQPIAIWTAPRLSIKASGSGSCHCNIMSQLSTPHDQMIKRPYSTTVGIATAGSNPQPNTSASPESQKNGNVYAWSVYSQLPISQRILLPQLAKDPPQLASDPSTSTSTSKLMHLPLRPGRNFAQSVWSVWEDAARSSPPAARGDAKLLYSKRTSLLQAYGSDSCTRLCTSPKL